MTKVNYTHAGMVAEYRNKSGFSQAQLASMLNVSRTLISMVEWGLRNLPPLALDILEKLITTVDSNEKVSGKHTDTLDLSPAELEVFCKELKERASEALYRRLLLLKKIKVMNDVYPHLIKTYQLLEQEFTKATQTGESTDHYRVALLRYQKKLTQSNGLSQLSLRFKTDLLLAEATVITQFLESC
jgi:transcriptional regulator with XRE-family HTH domain